MMSIACGQAGMLIGEFWDSTPKEIANKIQGFYDLRKSQIEYDWMIARAATFNIMAAFVGSDKIDFHKLSYFPILEDKERPKLTEDQTQAIIKRMDAHQKSKKVGRVITHRDLEQWQRR